MTKSQDFQASRPIEQTKNLISKGKKDKYKNLYDTLSTLVNEGVLISNLKGHIKYCNQIFCDISGFTKEEMVGKHFTNLPVLRKKDKPFYLKIFSKTLLKGKDGPFEYRWVHKDGSLRWGRGRTGIIKHQGKKIGMFIVVWEITKEKKADEEIHSISTMVEQAQDSIIHSDKNFKIIYINKAAEKLFGYKLKDLKGKTPDLFNAEPLAQEIQQEIYRTIAQGKSYVGEALNKRKDGSTFICHFKVSPLFDKDKNIIGYMGSQQDITEKKKAEEKIKNIAKFPSENPNPVLRVDKNGKILYMNQASVRFVNDKKFMVGKNVSQEWLGLIKKALKKNKILVQEINYHSKTHVVTITPFKKENYVNIYGADVTKLKQTEQEKQKLQEQLKKYTKQLEVKIKKIEKIPLNQKEKTVLAAITSYPHYNDQHLAQVSKLKRSTVTAIRNRLKKNNWYKKMNIPNLKILNYEDLSIFYHSPMGMDKETYKALVHHAKERPAGLFVQAGDNFSFGLTAYKSVAKEIDCIKKMNLFPQFKKIMQTAKQARFIIPASTIIKMFDYSNIINACFKLNFESEKPPPTPVGKLSKNEKELMYTFTKFPNANYQKVQELTRLSKPTIIRIKKKLFNQGHLKRTTIPNLKKLGYDFNCFIFHKTNQSSFKIKIFLDYFKKDSQNSFFTLIDEKQLLILSAYQDYHQMENALTNKKKIYQKLMHVFEEPEIYPFQSPKTFKLDFSGLIKEAFNLHVDY